MPEEKDRVEMLREEIREQRIAVGDLLEQLVCTARRRLDVVARVRQTMSANPLPFLGGGFALGLALGLGASDFRDVAKGIARVGWGGTKLALRLVVPAAI